MADDKDIDLAGSAEKQAASEMSWPPEQAAAPVVDPLTLKPYK